MIIETSSNVSTPFKPSNEITSVNENDCETALKLRTNEVGSDSSDSEVSSTLDNECPLNNMKEGSQKRKRQSLDSLSSSSSSKASSLDRKPKAKKVLKRKKSDSDSSSSSVASSDSMLVSNSLSESAREFEDFVLKSRETIRFRQLGKRPTKSEKLNLDDGCQVSELRHIGNNIVFRENGEIEMGSFEFHLHWTVFLDNRHKNWLVRADVENDVFDNDFVMKRMFLSDGNESQMKLSSILDHKRESPELVDAAESAYLRILFIRNLSESTQIIKRNVENFLSLFFNRTKHDCTTINKLKDSNVGVLLIGHFGNETKPVIFSLLTFDQFSDEAKEFPLVITHLATHPFFERQRLGSILLSALQCYCRCSEKPEKLFWQHLQTKKIFI